MTQEIIDLKTQARDKIKEAYFLLKSAGINETITNLVYTEEEFLNSIEGKDEYIEMFRCAICNNENITFSFKRNGLSLQYSLEVLLEQNYSDYSFWNKLKLIFRFCKNILIKEKDSSEILISYDEISRFKDMVKRLSW